MTQYPLQKIKLQQRFATAIAGIIFILTAIIIYAPALKSPFVLDDIPFIQNDPAIRMTELTKDTIVQAAFEGRPHRRLLPNLSFAVNYYFGRYDVAGYHVVNIAIHLIISILLFSLFKATLKIAPNCDMNSYGYARIAFFATLLWLVHPVATQSVTYVCQRMTSMAALFYVLSLLLYVKGRIIQRSAKLDVSMDRPKVVTPTNPGVQDTLQTLDSGLRRKDNQREFLTLLNIIKIKPALLFAGCILSGVAAVASKENAAMLPAFILLYEWFFFQDLKFTWSYNKVLWISVPAILFCLIALAYLGENPLSGILGIYSRRDFTLIQRVMTEWRVVIYYITLLFFPAPGRLNLEHDYPLSVAPIHPWTTLFSLTAIFCLILISLYTAKRHRLVSFCILWFLGNLAIESTVIGLEIIFEHRTYLPFLMPCLMAAGLAARICPSPKAFISLMCAATTLFSIWTYQRNVLWRDNILLLEDCVRKAPQVIRPRFNLATEYQFKGQFNAARHHLEKILAIKPYYLIAYTNLANIWAAQNNFEKAIDIYLAGLGLTPSEVKAKNQESAAAYLNIGSILLHRQMVDEAVFFLETALNITPDNDAGFTLAGLARMKQGRHEAATRHFQKALQLNSENTLARNHLIQLANPQQWESEKITGAAEAEIYPENISLHLKLGGFFRQQGDLERAKVQYRKILRISPSHAEAMAGLTVCGD